MRIIMSALLVTVHKGSCRVQRTAGIEDKARGMAYVDGMNRQTERDKDIHSGRVFVLSHARFKTHKTQRGLSGKEKWPVCNQLV